MKNIIYWVLGLLALYAVVSSLHAAEFKGHLAKEGKFWWVFDVDGQIYHCPYEAKDLDLGAKVECYDLNGKARIFTKTLDTEGYIK